MLTAQGSSTIFARSMPTDEELKKRYKCYRNLKIERDETSLTVTYDEPCQVCGKYHHKKKNGFGYRSKIGKKHELELFTTTVDTLISFDKED